MNHLTTYCHRIGKKMQQHAQGCDLFILVISFIIVLMVAYFNRDVSPPEPPDGWLLEGQKNRGFIYYCLQLLLGWPPVYVSLVVIQFMTDTIVYWGYW
jgi:hypothetical protein